MPTIPTCSWRRAFGSAALALWLPTLLPFVFGPLTECGHCVGVYAACLPLMPAVIVPVLMGVQSGWFVVTGLVAAVAVVLVLAVALRELPKALGLAACGLAALAVGAQALALGAAVRM